MKAPRSRFEYFYAAALRLYPARFRAAYAAAMQQALHDALADPDVSRATFLPLLIRDLMVSLVKENIAMVRESLARPVLVFNALVLAGIASGVALALYAIPQQVLRQGLNDPQIQMAGDVAARLEHGGTPNETVPQGEQVDMAQSLAPFVIVYDEQGHPLASQAVLNGAVPAPPSGVFDYVRQHGEERVSWQPVRGSQTVNGVRIAAVVERVSGAHPGFVLAGRNMREVEAREGQVREMAGLTWLGMLGVILVGCVAFGWYTRPKAGPPTHATPAM
ncbi:MAG TPA: hypothetical protein VKR52_12625 [Terracidiphilus sp.]|nr:hypothetical protein [Terracidiphilus sp.]